MRAALVLLLFLGTGFLGICPPSAVAQPQPEFFSITTGSFGPDSIRVNLYWTKDEKETATLRLILMDFEGRRVHTWQERVKLHPGAKTIPFAKFGRITPSLYGLDSSNALLGIEVKLSCGCETRQAVHYYRPVTKQALADPKLRATVHKDRKGWFLRIGAQRLARQVQILAIKQNWILSDNRFDILPGEEKEVRLQPTALTLKPKSEEFLLQSAYSPRY